jgi:hypothetical protein
MMTASDNDSGHQFERDLQELIRNRQVVAVIGSGVSRATNTRSLALRMIRARFLAECSAGPLDNAWRFNNNAR